MATIWLLVLIALSQLGVVHNQAGCPRIVTRAQWGARAPKSTSSINRPVPKVFIQHTVTPPCFSQSDCSGRVRSIQNYHMNDKGWADIGYNFLIGEDGNVYEGRGWDLVGAHTLNWNSLGIGIAFIGNFQNVVPNSAAEAAVKALLVCGVNLGKLSPSFLLHGHRDGSCTNSPGDALYNLITTADNYGGRLNGAC